jgi:AcrR family transcriptional regulator
VTVTREPYGAAKTTLLRTIIFGAVAELVSSRGWKATTMADVADAAGVSRQTVYNEFGSRQALVEAYIVREVQGLLDEVSDTVREHADDPHRALESAFALFLKLASDEPFVQIVVSNTEGSSRAENGRGETGEILQLVTALAYPIGVAQVSALITEIWPQASATDAKLVADTLVRLAVSHALYPTAAASDVAGEVGRMIAPFVDAVLN